MNSASFLAAAFAILAPAGAWALDTDVGASAAAGTGGYRRLTAFADVESTGARVEPYGWIETSFSRELRQFAFGGGVWDNWTETSRGKAGLGFAGGRYYDDDRGVSSLIAEAGVEKDEDLSTFGAGWRLTYGSLSSSRDSPSVEKAANTRSRGRRAGAADVERFAVNELSVYGRTRAGDLVPGLRLGLELPQRGRAITSETASVRLPLGKRSWLTPAVTFEQGGVDAVYLSLTAYTRL